MRKKKKQNLQNRLSHGGNVMHSTFIHTVVECVHVSIMNQSDMFARWSTSKACIEHILSANRCTIWTVNQHFVQFPCYFDSHGVIHIWQSPSHTQYLVCVFNARTPHKLSIGPCFFFLSRCFVLFCLDSWFRYIDKVHQRREKNTLSMWRKPAANCILIVSLVAEFRLVIKFIEIKIRIHL